MGLYYEQNKEEIEKNISDWVNTPEKKEILKKKKCLSIQGFCIYKKDGYCISKDICMAQTLADDKVI